MTTRRTVRRVVAVLPEFGWTGASQTLWSLSNVVISLTLARAGGANELGVFTVAFSFYLLTLGAYRSLVTEPLLTLSTFRDEPHDNFAVTLGVAIGSCLAAPALIFGFILGMPEIAVLGALAPGLLAHDGYRYALFRRGKASAAAMLDVVWLGTSVAAIPIVLRGSAAEAVAVWAAGASVGACVGVAKVGLPGRPRKALAWWRKYAKRLGLALVTDSLFYGLGTHAVTLGLAALLGAAQLGRLRAAQLLLAPATLILTAFNVFALPRLARHGPGTSRTALAISASASVVGVAAVGASLLVVEPLRNLLLGETFDVGMPLLVPVALVILTTAAGSGFALGLKAMRQGGGLVGARIVAIALGAPLVLGLAAVKGIVQAAWGMTIQAAILLIATGGAWFGARDGVHSSQLISRDRRSTHPRARGHDAGGSTTSP